MKKIILLCLILISITTKSQNTYGCLFITPIHKNYKDKTNFTVTSLSKRKKINNVQSYSYLPSYSTSKLIEKLYIIQQDNFLNVINCEGDVVFKSNFHENINYIEELNIYSGKIGLLLDSTSIYLTQIVNNKNQILLTDTSWERNNWFYIFPNQKLVVLRKSNDSNFNSAIIKIYDSSYRNIICFEDSTATFHNHFSLLTTSFSDPNISSLSTKPKTELIGFWINNSIYNLTLDKIYDSIYEISYEKSIKDSSDFEIRLYRGNGNKGYNALVNRKFEFIFSFKDSFKSINSIQERPKKYSFTYDTIYMKSKYGIIDINKKVLLEPKYNNDIKFIWKDYYYAETRENNSKTRYIIDSNFNEVLKFWNDEEVSTVDNSAISIKDSFGNYYLWKYKYLTDKLKFIKLDYTDNTYYYEDFNNKKGWFDKEGIKIKKTKWIKEK